MSVCLATVSFHDIGIYGKSLCFAKEESTHNKSEQTYYSFETKYVQ